MNYQELSPQGETLLKEIIDLQASDQDNAAYWSKRFDGLSMQQDTLLRDTFRELKECGYVHIQWADNIPYYLSLTVDGHDYFTNKKAAKKAERKLSRREWRIAVISAIIGGMVGLIPSSRQPARRMGKAVQKTRRECGNGFSEKAVS